MARLSFEISATSGRARTGRLHTRRGMVDTPAFMPVGTQGTVKGLLPEEVSDLGAQMILGNTYHLLLRPGVKTVADLGGLHRFMNWPGSILTDSGGFQVFSLSGLRSLDEQGASFRSHLDGQLLRMTPESVVEAQEMLGSDIMMVLDECPPPGSPREYLADSLERDARWAARALAARTDKGGALLGIVQGGVYSDLRTRSVELLAALELDGYALGGLSVGEPKPRMMEVIDGTVPQLPDGKPVYLMGVGEPADLVRCVGLGVDMFDCVLPTRMARTGTLLTSKGRLNLRNSRFKDDPRPVEEGCECPTCRHYSRAYLRHLVMAKELLAYRLNTVHNLHYILQLMAGLRRAIAENKYETYARQVLAGLEPSGQERVALT
ncbi:MAG: tRNA guanosine(34) transglycosylase Tgt [Proteobacteria bacterium]|nr:tRNA guanosine(34) transglycosylase Tgt [Pseudomonadota bacterium]MBU4275794.1 tRNA guanosine(34) transglycosylase Tgt [Pseudomonadota bacterium]MBU4383829.1 tRNA guanosine(34) transglycosylase Tgt [Pseudomonadota bacterium]MBU4603582.1 tRNA guanosine(34) transglycosylase Tgt [Pseudomonadota bacterium]MCG2763471.1 tRNA guanosine(34) transglycosylase Tgt [Desulfarculaceae bacterium]